jgi:ribosome-associated protein
VETAQESGWTVIDLFDLMVHLFSAERRAQYGLENLWKDATEVSIAKLLAVAKPKPAVKRRPATRKKPAAKK